MEEPPEYLAERLRQRLAEDGRVNALGVKVTVRGGEVVLAGSVATSERRDAAAEVAGEELPGLTVQNELRITEISAARGAEEVG